MFRIREVLAALLMTALVTPPALSVEYRFYHPDPLGTNALVTDRAGSVVQRTTHRPFGQVEHQVDGEGNIVGTSERYLFTDKERDAESDLSYFGARYYDPLIGRFDSSDPAFHDERLLTVEGEPAFMNGHAYALNRPTVLLDPDGAYLETAFDLVSLAASIDEANKAETTSDRIVANLAVAADLLAVALPFSVGAGILVKVGGQTLDVPVTTLDTTYTVIPRERMEVSDALRRGIIPSGRSDNLGHFLTGGPSLFTPTFRTPEQARLFQGEGSVVAVRPRDGLDVRELMSRGGAIGPGTAGPGSTGDPFLDAVIPIPGVIHQRDIRGALSADGEFSVINGRFKR